MLPKQQKVPKVIEERFKINDDEKDKCMFISWKDKEGKTHKVAKWYARCGMETAMGIMLGKQKELRLEYYLYSEG